MPICLFCFFKKCDCSLHLQYEIEGLKQQLLERERHIVSMETTFLTHAQKFPNGELAALGDELVVWQDKYSRYLNLIFVLFRQKLFLLSLDINIFFTLSNAKQKKYWNRSNRPFVNSKGPQIMITEPMVSIKVTNCSLQSG